MHGISSVRESGLRSYEKLKGVAKELASFGPTEEEVSKLIQAISTSQTYMKTHYPLNLKMHWWV